MLPLSDPRTSRNRPLAASARKAARDSVRQARRWVEEARVAELARDRYRELLLSGRWWALDAEDKESGERQAQAVARRTRVCVYADDLEEALARPAWPLLCYGEPGRGASFRAIVPEGALVFFFGEAEVDLTLQPAADVYLFGDVRGVARAPEAIADARVTLFERARLVAEGQLWVQARDDAFVSSRSLEASVHLNDRARLELEQAKSVWASQGTTVVLTDGAVCAHDVEVDDYYDSGASPAQVLNEAGELLVVGNELRDPYYRQLTPTVRVSASIPF